MSYRRQRQLTSPEPPCPSYKASNSSRIKDVEIFVMDIPVSLQEALRDSIASGTFVDTKFWVFSKRGSRSRRIGEPKALFVNGHVAKRVPRLRSLLDERGTKENLRGRFPTDRKPYASNYDYEDDSDLEEDEDEDVLDDEPASVPQVVAEKPGNNSDVVVIESLDAKSNEPSDVVSISDIDSLFSESDTKGERRTVSSAHVGKVIIIEDVAFVTFQALLRYLYTNEIEFAPWGSTERRKARALEKISDLYGIPKPSPKSVYRLADRYDIPELKELALRQIQQDLSKCDIIEEAFSKYTSWYPELRELELSQLARALLSSDSNPTLGLLKAKIKSYTHGQSSHADHILSALYELMEGDEPVRETPLLTTAPSNRQVTGEDWDGLKKALTSSLTSGTFLDSQFYAVESRSLTGSPKIRPIYFCSTVDVSFVSKLVSYSSKLTAQGTPPLRCEDEYDSDIDDENPDLEGSTECYPYSSVRENAAVRYLPTEPALLLKSGAVKTWSAIFLCVYIGHIVFGALGSQDVTTESEARDDCLQGERKSPQDSEGLSIPTPGAIAVNPCSPKSVYCLADKVGLTELCDLAFKDIQSKLDENNIVQELFSPFTANHKLIREMEHELFQLKLKSSVNAGLLSDIIRSSSSGKNSHRTAAMELIFERSIQTRRKRMFTKVNGLLWPDPTHPPMRSWEGPTSFIPQVQSPAPATASQLLRSPSDVAAGTAAPAYVVFNEKDPANAYLTLKYQSIVCMPAYRGYSFEELRLQDYQQNCKTAATGGFNTGAFDSTTQPGTTGGWSSQTQPTIQPTQSAFGGAGFFGSTDVITGTRFSATSSRSKSKKKRKA